MTLFLFGNGYEEFSIETSSLFFSISQSAKMDNTDIIWFNCTITLEGGDSMLPEWFEYGLPIGLLLMLVGVIVARPRLRARMRVTRRDKIGVIVFLVGCVVVIVGAFTI